jgi:hypothetical protein
MVLKNRPLANQKVPFKVATFEVSLDGRVPASAFNQVHFTFRNFARYFESYHHECVEFCDWSRAITWRKYVT